MSGLDLDGPSLARSGAAMLMRDLRLVWRRRGDAMQPVIFVLLVVTLFPLALGDDRELLARIAPGVLWIAVLLSGLLTMDTLFRGDHEDGSLEQMLLSPSPLAWLVALRLAVHWLTTALPLIILTPVLGKMLYLPGNLLGPLLVSLLVGTPLLSLVGGVVAALTVGMRRSGMMMGLLALPLYVPILVFGAGSVMLAAQGLPWIGVLGLLAGGLALAFVLAPLAAATALRIALT